MSYVLDIKGELAEVFWKLHKELASLMSQDANGDILNKLWPRDGLGIRDLQTRWVRTHKACPYYYEEKWQKLEFANERDCVEFLLKHRMSCNSHNNDWPLAKWTGDN